MRRRLRATSPVLALLVAFACNYDEDDEQFREEVFLCEEAVGRLAECCPGFEAQSVSCVYYRLSGTTACGQKVSERQDPALSLAQAECVLASSCDDVRGKDMCRRATAIASDAGVSGAGTGPRGSVCP